MLISAFHVEASQHREAKALLGRLAQGPRPWALPWPCVLEFVSYVTGPRPRRPTSLGATSAFLDLLFGSPYMRRLLPTRDTLDVLREVLDDSGVRGPDVHDAHIFALCLEHGVRELYTSDKGFRRFRGLKVTDPFRK